MKISKRFIALLAIVTTLLMFGCSSKGTIVSGDSHASSASAASGNQAVPDDSADDNGDPIGMDADATDSAGH